MGHLHPDELIDLAEGTRPESAAPHLLSCESCRRQLAEARALIAAAATVEVPEPSPLFWDHLSARVREAVLTEGAPRRVPPFTLWIDLRSWSRLVVPVSVGVVAALVMAALLTIHLTRISGGSAARPQPIAVAEMRPGELTPPADDPSLELVADLSEDMDWDSAREAGFLPRRGALERAVNHLDDVERQELQKLLKEELARGTN